MSPSSSTPSAESPPAAPPWTIAATMFITDKAVGKHTNGIFGKLGLEQSDDDNRRVLAVLAYLEDSPRD